MVPGRARRLLCAAACGALVAGCAAPPGADVAVGQIWTYIRANQDGTEAESIHVHRASSTRIEVMKARERCTSAAFVSAEIDPRVGDATRLTGGRLLPQAGRTEEAWLLLSADGKRLDLHLGRPDAPVTTSIPIAERPWHLYDFDFASLIAAPPMQARTGGDFSFGLALSLVRPDGLTLSWLGRVDAVYIGTTERLGRPARHFRVTGPGLRDAQGGELWTDARSGVLLEARLGLPNHEEYRDFSLTLRSESRGAETWHSLLTAQLRDCPQAAPRP